MKAALIKIKESLLEINSSFTLVSSRCVHAIADGAFKHCYECSHSFHRASKARPQECRLDTCVVINYHVEY